MKKNILILCLFAMLSCTNNNSEYSKLIDERYMRDEDLVDYNDTSAYKVIYLEENDTVFISEVINIAMTDSMIFVLDDHKAIRMYDITGKYISSIDKRGKGNGEYLSVESFIVEDNRILLFDSDNHRIIEYDFNGNALNVNNLVNFRGSVFSKLGDDNYLFHMFCGGYSPQNAEVLITDLNGEIIKECIPLKDYGDKRYFGPQNYFSKRADGVYFIPIFQDKLYRINSDLNMEKIFDLGIGDKMMTFEDVAVNRDIGTGTNKYIYFFEFQMSDNGVFYGSFAQGTDPIGILVDINKKLLRTTQISFYGNYKNYLITLDGVINYDREKGKPLILINTEKIKFTKE